MFNFTLSFRRVKASFEFVSPPVFDSRSLPRLGAWCTLLLPGAAVTLPFIFCVCISRSVAKCAHASRAGGQARRWERQQSGATEGGVSKARAEREQPCEAWCADTERPKSWTAEQKITLPDRPEARLRNEVEERMKRLKSPSPSLYSRCSNISND